MSGYNQNYYRDPYGYGYIQRPPTYNYAGYYQPAQFGQQPTYQQSWGQTSIATTQPLRMVTTQPTQTSNVVIPSQNTTTMVTLNTMTQTQNTTILPNIFNLTG